MSDFSEWVRNNGIIHDGWREYPSPVSADMSNISDHDNGYWLTDEADRMVGISASVSNPWQSVTGHLYEDRYGEIAPTNTGCLAMAEPHDCDWQLSLSDALGDKYKEMEKRVEEQDKTISELKSIIEDLQGIVYKKKLDKEAETLVL